MIKDDEIIPEKKTNQVWNEKWITKASIYKKVKQFKHKSSNGFYFVVRRFGMFSLCLCDQRIYILYEVRKQFLFIVFRLFLSQERIRKNKSFYFYLKFQ